MTTILIIDDDPSVSGALGMFFERTGHQVVRSGTAEEGIEAFLRVRPDLTLLDLRLPDGSGFDVLARLRGEESVIIMITAHGDVPLAVQAMQAGAENFLEKPIDLSHLGAAAARAIEKARLRRLVRHARERREITRVASLLGASPAMRELAQQVEMLAASERTTVLLVGESGTGKGRLADLMHAMSPRAIGPFVDVGCSAVAHGMLDAELFGSERTSSAGREWRAGLVEMAEGGTLFLDEVIVLDPPVQAKLLRLLDAGTFRRPGEMPDVAADVRIIAATSRDLVTEVNSGRFREDLYYRLNVMPVYLPPLRARAREDLVDLIARLARELRAQFISAPEEMTAEMLEHLLRYPWPGNIRELRNVLERAMIVGRGARRIGVEHLPAEMRRPVGAGVTRHEPRTLAEVERAHIERTLRAHNANRTHAARELGISRATLIGKIKEYNLAIT